MIKKTTLMLMTMLTVAFSYAQTTIIPLGSIWNYKVTSAVPPNDTEGDTWKSISFDDASWPSAPAQLGYGNNGSGDATTIGYGGNASAKYRTTYFRKTFTATAANVADDNLHLDGYIDDGMVVYLNGTEIWRDSNMPTGTIVYSTQTITDYEGSFSSPSLTNALILGTNTISVEVHQVNDTSSDLSFNLQLSTSSTAGPTPTAEAIPAGANWRYLDNGSDQGTTWRATAFDDSSWDFGLAELGYGDSDETTTVSFGSDANNKHITTYFRKEFTIADESIYNSIDLEAIRDDGMVVYLNGVEIWRDHMSGTVNYTTLADSPAIGGGDESTWITTSIAKTGLINGTNVIAVEIHQQALNSSDLSFNFKLTPSAMLVGAPSVIRGPYLQTGTSTSAIIKWRTNNATDSKVNYGTSVGSLPLSVSDGTSTTEHEITLSGLTPNTKYYFDIANSSDVYLPAEAEMYVITAPTPGTDQFVRAWVLGDAGTANTNQRNVRDAYYNYIDGSGPTGTPTNPDQTDMMLFLGDNAYNNGTDSEYQLALFDIYDDMLKKSVAWSCLGNHDGYSVDFNTQSGPYYDIFSFPTAGEAGGTASGTEEYYSFDYANIHFIVLQSNNVDGGGTQGTFNTSQKAWLTSDINATTQDWIVAFFHHPPYTKGSHDSDNDGETGLKTMREQYIPILEAGGVDLILSGHSHSYERSKFVKGHTGYSSTFDPNPTTSGGHTVGTNGNESGRADTVDLAYIKSDTDTDGAVYITAGSSGKATGAQFNGQDPYTGTNTLPVMYYSAQSLGSTILEVEDDGSGGQNMNVKFLRDTGVIDDYFTISKTGGTLSVDADVTLQNNLKLFPVPANDLLNIHVNLNERLQSVKFYNTIGELVREGNKETINVSNMKTGMYLVEIATDKSTYYKSIIIE